MVVANPIRGTSLSNKKLPFKGEVHTVKQKMFHQYEVLQSHPCCNVQHHPMANLLRTMSTSFLIPKMMNYQQLVPGNVNTSTCDTKKPSQGRMTYSCTKALPSPGAFLLSLGQTRLQNSYGLHLGAKEAQKNANGTVCDMPKKAKTST